MMIDDDDNNNDDDARCIVNAVGSAKPRARHTPLTDSLYRRTRLMKFDKNIENFIITFCKCNRVYLLFANAVDE